MNCCVVVHFSTHPRRSFRRSSFVRDFLAANAQNAGTISSIGCFESGAKVHAIMSLSCSKTPSGVSPAVWGNEARGRVAAAGRSNPPAFLRVGREPPRRASCACLPKNQSPPPTASRRVRGSTRARCAEFQTTVAVPTPARRPVAHLREPDTHEGRCQRRAHRARNRVREHQPTRACEARSPTAPTAPTAPGHARRPKPDRRRHAALVSSFRSFSRRGIDPPVASFRDSPSLRGPSHLRPPDQKAGNDRFPGRSPGAPAMASSSRA